MLPNQGIFKLGQLAEGALHQIKRHDYERPFGTNDVAMARLCKFAGSHECAASFTDHAILFRRRLRNAPPKLGQ